MSQYVRPYEKSGITWQRWPGHIAVARPPCTGAPGCRQPPGRWQRCACGQVFSSCGDHLRDLSAERAAHTCPGAP